jgi:hypothetical protein
MRIVPENEQGLIFHLTTGLWMGSLIAMWMISPPLVVLGKGRWFIERWPEIYWVGIPLVSLIVNAAAVFFERSFLGFFCVAGNFGWLVFSQATLPTVLSLLKTL